MAGHRWIALAGRRGRGDDVSCGYHGVLVELERLTYKSPGYSTNPPLTPRTPPQK